MADLTLRRRQAEVVPKMAALAVAYVVFARVGLSIDAVGGFATFVWAPSGIALAMLVLFGRPMWPAVAAGAFVANAIGGVPILVALGIASGNTLEAFLGALALQRFAGLHRGPDSVRSVLCLVTFGASLSTLVSATIGVGCLATSGLLSSAHYLETWRAWWIGDALGDLVVAPFVLAWWPGVAETPSPSRLASARVVSRRLEVVLLALTLTSVSVLAFFRPRGTLTGPFFAAYMVYPFIMWGAVRFELRGATATTLLVAVLGVSATALGRGPFARASLSLGLLFLQTFLAVLAVTMLVLAGSVVETRRALEAREEFLSIASHELRTPLTSLQLQVQALLRNLRLGRTEQTSTERIHRNVETIARQSDRLEQLIEDLLDVTRIAAGQLSLELSEVDLGRVVGEVLERMQEQARRAKCEVTVSIGAPIVGRWDAQRLTQVVTNLLSNAIKYGAGKPIEVWAEAHGKVARLRVRDHGIGVPIKDQARIFDRFERAAPSHNYGGLGLGLWITRQIVTRMGGRIWVESSVNEGAAFAVELPLTNDRASLSPLRGDGGDPASEKPGAR